MKILLELRPAFDGHSGIPQETRLLFRGLMDAEGIEMQGLLQSSNLIIEPGMPVHAGMPVKGLMEDDRVGRLSRVVVSLHQGAAPHRLLHWRRRLQWMLAPAASTLASMLESSGFRWGSYSNKRPPL